MKIGQFEKYTEYLATRDFKEYGILDMMVYVKITTHVANMCTFDAWNLKNLSIPKGNDHNTLLLKKAYKATDLFPRLVFRKCK